jgi:hypothetical protein
MIGKPMNTTLTPKSGFSRFLQTYRVGASGSDYGRRDIRDGVLPAQLVHP